MYNVIYIAGAITNDPNYQSKFDKAEQEIRSCGDIPLNPTVLPQDLDYNKYFPICFGMIDVSDAVVVLDGVETSEGIQREMNYVWNTSNIPIFNGIDSYKLNHKDIEK